MQTFSIYVLENAYRRNYHYWASIAILLMQNERLDVFPETRLLKYRKYATLTKTKRFDWLGRGYVTQPCARKSTREREEWLIMWDQHGLVACHLSFIFPLSIGLVVSSSLFKRRLTNRWLSLHFSSHPTRLPFLSFSPNNNHWMPD